MNICILLFCWCHSCFTDTRALCDFLTLLITSYNSYCFYILISFSCTLWRSFYIIYSHLALISDFITHHYTPFSTRTYFNILCLLLCAWSCFCLQGILYRSTLIHIALDACIHSIYKFNFDFCYCEWSSQLKQSITMQVRISFSKGNRADGASSRSIFSTVFNCIEVTIVESIQMFFPLISVSNILLLSRSLAMHC